MSGLRIVVVGLAVGLAFGLGGLVGMRVAGPGPAPPVDAVRSGQRSGESNWEFCARQCERFGRGRGPYSISTHARGTRWVVDGCTCSETDETIHFDQSLMVLDHCASLLPQYQWRCRQMDPADPQGR